MYEKQDKTKIRRQKTNVRNSNSTRNVAEKVNARSVLEGKSTRNAGWLMAFDESYVK